MKRLNKRSIGIVVVFVIASIVAILYWVASREIGRIEPRLREMAVRYLEQRFDADVNLGQLHVGLPHGNIIGMWFRRGKGTLVEVSGGALTLRLKKRPELPTLLSVNSFRGQADLGTLLSPSHRLADIYVDGLVLQVPPKEQRPVKSQQSKDKPESGSLTNLFFDRVHITNTKLLIISKKPKSKPLEFIIRKVELTSTGDSGVMEYSADMTNAKPPGDILCQGKFGPWNRDAPGDSPLNGKYDFNNADLGVFKAIAGTLHSSGTFDGTLSSIIARGEATVPNFRLKRSNNKITLKTDFEILVDGTNGNTELKPVHAFLGSTPFTTDGIILRREGQERRTIELRVKMPRGKVEDLLQLAMSGPPFLEGKINLNADIKIPPLEGKVKDKLNIDAHFDISNALFRKSTIRERLDGLSRRAQGEPKNMAIEDVPSLLAGKFHLQDQNITFEEIVFSVPGADVQLTGTYAMENQDMNFEGALMLDAKASQTLTGWKRILVKPFDPILAKKGAGTYLKIKITGDAQHPHFSARP